MNGRHIFFRHGRRIIRDRGIRFHFSKNWHSLFWFQLILQTFIEWLPLSKCCAKNEMSLLVRYVNIINGPIIVSTLSINQSGSTFLKGRELHFRESGTMGDFMYSVHSISGPLITKAARWAIPLKAIPLVPLA